MTYPMARVARSSRVLDLDSFSRSAGVHPELVYRLVALGLLEPRRDPAGELWFDSAQLARIGRIKRLKAGFSLNYAALGLVLELLEQIAELEAAARRVQRSGRTPGG